MSAKNPEPGTEVKSERFGMPQLMGGSNHGGRFWFECVECTVIHDDDSKKGKVKRLVLVALRSEGAHSTYSAKDFDAMLEALTPGFKAPLTFKVDVTGKAVSTNNPFGSRDKLMKSVVLTANQLVLNAAVVPTDVESDSDVSAAMDASITPPVVTSVGAPRGGRMPYEESKFYFDRMSRLTASLLPFWMGLPGNFSTIARDKIVRILNANSGRWVLPVENAYAREMLNWGINNENNGIYAYMEITRKLVGLGSTRIRDALATEQHITDDPKKTRWEWSDLLGSTPDGFIYDLDVGDPGFADLGLLEIKCPAYKQITPRGMMRRHDVEYHIKPETNYYILLQLWEQLETCPDALYVDLVNWKRDKPYEEGRGEQYIWIQRLYRDDVKHASIKKMLQSSFGEFARALRAMEDDASDGTRDEEAETEWQEDRAGARMTQRQRGEKEMSVPGYTAATFSQANRQKLRDELDAWVYGSMRWQNTLEPPYYPWRSKASLDLAGMPLTGLACRYRLSNGETATHFGKSGDSGYRVLPVNARSLYDTEVL